MLFWYSEVCIEGEFRVHRACHDPESLIFCDSLLKEVGFPLQGNGLHEVKWIFCIVHLIEGQKQCQKRQKACIHCTTCQIKQPWPAQGRQEDDRRQTRCTVSSGNSSFQSNPLTRPPSETPAIGNMSYLHPLIKISPSGRFMSMER